MSAERDERPAQIATIRHAGPVARTKSKSRRPTSDPDRKPRLIAVAFLLVTLVAVALLGAAVVTGPLADVWHPVVTVNGATINRTELRARIAIDAALLASRRLAARSMLSSGRLTVAQHDLLTAQLDAAAADPLRIAIDGLVDDAILREAAASRGVAIAAEPTLEFKQLIADAFVDHLRAVTLAQPDSDAAGGVNGPGMWPAPASNQAAQDVIAAARDAAAAKAHDALVSGTPPTDVAASLTSAGWRSQAVDRWLLADGPVAGIPDALLAAVRDATTADGAVVGPFFDPVTGTTAVGIRVERRGSTIPDATVSTDGLDAGTLQRWAEARVAERGLRQALVADWGTQPQPLVRVAELVIGPADVQGQAGEYRSFAHLVVSQLPVDQHGAGTDAEAADRIQAELGALPADDRIARFGDLMIAANSLSPTDLHRSGETGYYRRDELLPALGEAAFASGVETGDVLGPVTTPAGTELFIARGRFAGQLDERSGAALVEARTTADLLALAHRISPVGEWERADGTLWRALAELDDGGDAHRAYRDTPLGQLSDPFVLDNEIIVVRPLERTSGPVPPDALARLAVRGFDAWLAGTVATATISRDPEPMPGVLVASPTPSGTATAPPGGAGIPTPYLPSLPATP